MIILFNYYGILHASFLQLKQVCYVLLLYFSFQYLTEDTTLQTAYLPLLL